MIDSGTICRSFKKLHNPPRRQVAGPVEPATVEEALAQAFSMLAACDLELARSAPRAVENDLRRSCLAQEPEPQGRLSERPGSLAFLASEPAPRNGQLKLGLLHRRHHRTWPRTSDRIPKVTQSREKLGKSAKSYGISECAV